jgi:hypothetical protein
MFIPISVYNFSSDGDDCDIQSMERGPGDADDHIGMTSEPGSYLTFLKRVPVE